MVIELTLVEPKEANWSERVEFAKPGYLSEIETLAKVEVEWLSQITEDPQAPEALKDFLEGAPKGYHTVSSDAPSSKQYPPDELQRVIEYLKSFPARKLAED